MASVELDPIFLETVTIDENNPMKVFITLNGDSQGVWVEKGTSASSSTSVRAGRRTSPSTGVSVAKRRGLESFRLDVFDEEAMRIAAGGDPLDPWVRTAPQDDNDEVVEEVVVRRPNADERGSVADVNTAPQATPSVDAPERQ